MTPSERTHLGNRLRTERETRRWSKPRMARELLNAADAPQSRTRITSLVRQIYDWENGQHFPRDWTTAYATAYAIPENDLFPPPQQQPAAVPTGTVDLSSTPDLGDDDVKRRALLQLLAALGAGQAIPPGTLEHVLSGIDDALGNPLDIDEWNSVVHEYGQVLVTRPAGALVKGLTADLIAVGELLNRPNSEQDKAGLLRVSAGLSGLLAIDLGDAGDQRAARISWGTARRTADASGDQDLRVWVRGRAAQDAAMAARPASVVVTLADDAIRIAGATPSGGLARAHAARAYAATDQGDTTQAHASLAALARTFDQLPDGTGEQTPLAYRETQLLWAQSYVRALTGDNKADQTVTQALALYPPSAVAPITNLSLMRAAMLVKSRDIDTGLEHALNSLQPGHGRVTSAGARLITSKIVEALPAPARTLPAAQELQALTAGT